MKIIYSNYLFITPTGKEERKGEVSKNKMIRIIFHNLHFKTPKENNIGCRNLQS